MSNDRVIRHRDDLAEVKKELDRFNIQYHVAIHPDGWTITVDPPERGLLQTIVRAINVPRY